MIRNIFLMICLSGSTFVYSQSEVDDLNQRRAVILSEIERMKDSIKQLENKLETHEIEEFKNRLDHVKLLGVVKEKNTRLNNYPKHNSSVALFLNKRDKVEIIDYSWTNYFYHVKYQDKTGYVYSRQIKDTDDLRAFRVLKIKEGKKIQEEEERMKEAEHREYLKRQAEAVERNRLEKERRARKFAEEVRKAEERAEKLRTERLKQEQLELEQREKLRKERLKQEQLELERREKERIESLMNERVQAGIIEKRLIERFGQEVYSRLKNGDYWLGMTEEMATISLGWPKDINRSVGAWGVQEQWVYGNGVYLYFKNGILESYQN